jgi:hypothetical protein
MSRRRVDDPIGAHVARWVVEHGHPRTHPGPDDERLAAQMLAAELLHHRRERRYDAGDRRPVEMVVRHTGPSEEAAHQDPVLVLGLIPPCREPPLATQLDALKQADDRVRVADVDHENAAATHHRPRPRRARA